MVKLSCPVNPKIPLFRFVSSCSLEETFEISKDDNLTHEISYNNFIIRRSHNFF